jgi:hypothetical protein
LPGRQWSPDGRLAGRHSSRRDTARQESQSIGGQWDGRRRVDGTNPVPEDQRRTSVPMLPLTSIGELLAEPDEPVDYIIEGLITKGSVNATLD